MNIAYTRMFPEKHDVDYISNYALDYLAEKISMRMGIDLPFGVDIDFRILKQERAGSFLFYEAPFSIPIEKT